MPSHEPRSSPSLASGSAQRAQRASRPLSVWKVTYIISIQGFILRAYDDGVGNESLSKIRTGIPNTSLACLQPYLKLPMNLQVVLGSQRAGPQGCLVLQSQAQPQMLTFIGCNLEFDGIVIHWQGLQMLSDSYHRHDHSQWSRDTRHAVHARLCWLKMG